MRLHRWLPWAAVAFLLVLLLCHQWYGPDIWEHLYLGGQVARTFNPQPPDHLILRQSGFINVYWLFQLIMRGVYALGGIAGVSFLFILFWGAAFGFWLRTTGLPRAGAWGAAVALAAVLICQTRFEERPEVLSYVFLAMQIHWLAAWSPEESPRRGELFRFTLVEVLWANIHGHFIFGPLLVALRIASVAASPSGISRRSWIGLWQLLGLAALASLASPFGWRNWEEIAVYPNVLHQFRHSIQELLPTWRVPGQVWTVDLFWLCWPILFGGIVWIALTAARKELFALVLAALGLALGTLTYRNIPFAIFLGGPLIGCLRARLAPEGRCPRGVPIAVAALSLALAAWVVSGGFYRSMRVAGVFGIGESPAAYPVGFAGYLRANGFSGSIFNHMADGGYLEFHFPGLRLYGDSRVTEAAPVRRYFAALRDHDTFLGLQAECGFDGALLPITDSEPLIEALSRDRAWRVAYADLHRVFFVNLVGSAGRGAYLAEPEFYGGEDLTLPQNTTPAVLWVALFARLNDRENLLRALRAFSAAPAVPSSLVEIALHYGWRRSDPEVTAAAAVLRTKEFRTRPISREMMNRILGAP